MLALMPNFTSVQQRWLSSSASRVPLVPLQERVPAGFKGWGAQVVGADTKHYDDGVHCTVKFLVSSIKGIGGKKCGWTSLMCGLSGGEGRSLASAGL